MWRVKVVTALMVLGLLGVGVLFWLIGREK